MLVKLAPLAPPATDAPAEATPENLTEQASEEVVTLAPEEDGSGAAAEETEAAQDPASNEEKSDDGGAKGEEKPQKLSRSQRRNRKLAEQAATIRNLQSELARRQANGDEVALPRPQDFETPQAFARALHAFEARRIVREENARGARASETAAVAAQERAAGYQQRLSEIADRLPDFDAAVRASRDVAVRDDIIELIQESAKGPLIVFYLAKNPDKIVELNRLSQRAAAREIGRLEARIRGPQPKRHTSAPPPISPPRGGTGGIARKVEHMSMDEFVRERDAGRL